MRNIFIDKFAHQLLLQFVAKAFIGDHQPVTRRILRLQREAKGSKEAFT